MAYQALEELTQALKSSTLIASLAQANKKPAGYQKLTAQEVEKLKSQGNWAEDWSEVKVKKGFHAASVVNCRFLGENYLGISKGKVTLDNGVVVHAGLYDSTFSHAIVGDNVYIKDAKLISRYAIGKNAVIMNVGELVFSGKSNFGNGTEIPIAIETGGRDLKIYAEITIPAAAEVCTHCAEESYIGKYQGKIEEYLKRLKTEYAVVEESGVVKNTPKVRDTFVGAHAHIDSAVAVYDTTILSNKEEKVEIKDGAFVKSSVIQWGAEVATGAIVDSSALTEHSHVERHGKVTNSVVGPNTGIAEGEVTACLVGPFVGLHHQSLLIAAFWPEGKGNIGYGANVGSNHTSKAPDQEIWPGEGVFFGLGVNIKFPSNFSKAPYTIIATAVNALPQRMEFPFSLVNTTRAIYPGISPAYNEIFPAWVLSDNIFTVKRNEGKYIKRNKAKRSDFVFEVFRPDIVDLMCEARRRLKEVTQTKEIYTAKDIEGLGKNYMLESSRKKAIAAYTFYIQYYALLGLKKRLSGASKTQAKSVLATATKDARWEHERKVLAAEFGEIDLKDALTKLSQMQEKIAQDVKVSKEKDDVRGKEVIDDYDKVHKPAEKDSFVKQTFEETEKMKKEIAALIKNL